MLGYVKGGAAVTSDKYNGLLGGITFDAASETRWGGVVGAGIEVGFAPGWSVAVEYDHLFMGSRNVNFNARRPSVAISPAPTISVRTSTWAPSA